MSLPQLEQDIEVQEGIGIIHKQHRSTVNIENHARPRHTKGKLFRTNSQPTFTTIHHN